MLGLLLRFRDEVFEWIGVLLTALSQLIDWPTIYQFNKWNNSSVYLRCLLIFSKVYYFSRSLYFVKREKG